MAERCLIIGGHTGGIGDAVAAEIGNPPDWEIVPEIFKPTVDEVDVRDPKSIELYIAENGPFDKIVYSAGVSYLQWIKNVSQGYLDRTFDVNVFGAILIARFHVVAFPERKVRYAVVVSDASHTPMRGSIAYCMSKAALEMGVKVMARELAPLWTVVAVSPGVVEDTGMTNKLAEDIPKFRGWTPEQAREYEDKSSVLGRRITKEEVAETVVFALNGPEALNGSTLTINGGK